MGGKRGSLWVTRKIPEIGKEDRFQLSRRLQNDNLKYSQSSTSPKTHKQNYINTIANILPLL